MGGKRPEYGRVPTTGRDDGEIGPEAARAAGEVSPAAGRVHHRVARMFTPRRERCSPRRHSTADGILDAMDLTSHVLVVLGLVAGAVVGAVTVAALLMLAGVDTHGSPRSC